MTSAPKKFVAPSWGLVSHSTQDVSFLARQADFYDLSWTPCKTVLKGENLTEKTHLIEREVGPEEYLRFNKIR